MKNNCSPDCLSTICRCDRALQVLIGKDLTEDEFNQRLINLDKILSNPITLDDNALNGDSLPNRARSSTAQYGLGKKAPDESGAGEMAFWQTRTYFVQMTDPSYEFDALGTKIHLGGKTMTVQKKYRKNFCGYFCYTQSLSLLLSVSLDEIKIGGFYITEDNLTLVIFVFYEVNSGIPTLPPILRMPFSQLVA